MDAQTDIRSLRDKSMPDVSESTKTKLNYALDKVGMGKIEMPVRVQVNGGEIFRQPAVIDAFVSLDDTSSKGIHMSRIYLALKEHLEKEVISLKTIKLILNSFVKSQGGLSKSAYLRVAFDLIVERQALVSGRKGWRQYPVVFTGSVKDGAFEYNLETEVQYSSTCPCSAALSRQLIQENFATQFEGQESLSVEQIYSWLGKESSISATPHAQRSSAFVKVKLDPNTIAPEPIDVIDRVETALKTPVQAAVKREDEQEFARLNAQNLMFCEDAARVLKESFEQESRFLDYALTVEHVESLHPHSAMSSVTKGVDGGFTS